jgi:membrane protein implicated in regulation of membrane protease activity
MLNDRSARMVGQSVIVVETVDAHKGRVRVGDSEWPARGPNLPVGATARIAAVTNGIVNIEPTD